MEAGFALDDFAISKFRGNSGSGPIRSVQRRNELTTDEVAAFKNSKFYEEISPVIGPSLKSVVNSRNEDAHPSKLVEEIELLMKKLDSVPLSKLDSEVLESIQIFRRMNNFPGMDQIILNYRKKKREEK